MSVIFIGLETDPENNYPDPHSVLINASIRNTVCVSVCRNSPTVMSVVELSVVEQASKPIILDDEGVQV